jgi:hypothetical protein
VFPADLEMGLLPNVHMSPVYVAGDVWREEPLMGQEWGLYAIASEALEGMLLNGGEPVLTRVARQCITMASAHLQSSIPSRSDDLKR